MTIVEERQYESVGEREEREYAERYTAMLVINRALQQRSLEHEGVFPLSDTLLRVYWHDDKGEHHNVDVSSYDFRVM